MGMMSVVVASFIAQLASPTCCVSLEDCLARVAAPPGVVGAAGPDPRPLVLHCEASTLARFGSPAVPRLVALLKHADWRVRDAAAAALAAINPAPAEAVPALMVSLARDPHGWSCSALVAIDDPRAAVAIVNNTARYESPPPLKKQLWTAAYPLAVDALGAKSTTWSGRNRLLDILEAHSEVPPPVAQAHALHRLLLAELQKKAWPRDADCSVSPFQVDAPPLRTLELSPCMPPAGYVILALRRFGPTAVFAIPDIERAIDRDPNRLEVAAGQTLIALGAPSARERISRELASASSELVKDGLSDVMQFPSSDAALLDQVRALLKHPDFAVAELAAFVLGRRGIPDGLAIVDAALRSTRFDSVNLAFATISQLGKRAASEEPVIRRLLAEHPSLAIRRSAAKTLLALTGEEPRVPAVLCGEKGGSFAGLPGQLEVCDEAATCLVGIDHGEFGGEVVEQRDGGSRLLAKEINPRGFFSVGSQRYLLSGLSHMDARGELWRVSSGPSPQLEHVTDLPGTPTGWRVEGRNLVVVTNGENVDANPCGERVLVISLP